MPQLSKGEILDRLAVGESLRGLNLVRADLSHTDLSQADLSEANLRMADLTGSDLHDAVLSGCFLSGAALDQANFTGANLVQASLIGATARRANLGRADLSGADLTGADLSNADLSGAYLLGTYLNETDLAGANLSSAFLRMAQMSGCNLSDARLEGADLSFADLSGARLDGCSLYGANLSGANLSATVLTNCDLRGADLSNADLSGANLTGARLRDVKYAGAKLEDAWADWVDISGDSGGPKRAMLEEVFTGIMSKPVAQLLVEGAVNDDAWAVILAHLCDFRNSHPQKADVRLKAIHQGTRASALYLEADSETSLASYLLELADIMGKGSVELFEKLTAVMSDQKEVSASAGFGMSSGFSSESPLDEALAMAEEPLTLGLTVTMRVEALQHTTFWNSEKAVVILTGDRRVWLEASSNDTLTLRPPRGATPGVDLVRGRFVVPERREQNAPVHK